MKAELFSHHIMSLGEGPVWDERTQTLYWVDISAGNIWSYDMNSGITRTHSMGETVGMCCLTEDGALVAALKHDIVVLQEDTRTVLFGGIEAGLPHNRFNDGKVDARGRLLAGTMDTTGRKGQGALYSFTQGKHPATLAGDISCSNGLGWSADNRTLYYVDTPTGYLWGFDYDIETGAVANRRSLIDYTAEQGSFDGLCVDDEDMLWVAHWGGHRVSRWNPQTGRKIGEIMVPAPYVTSCCFGGDNMDMLFITTARGSEDTAAQYPHAGALFVAQPGVTGPVAHRYALGECPYV